MHSYIGVLARKIIRTLTSGTVLVMDLTSFIYW